MKNIFLTSILLILISVQSLGQNVSAILKNQQSLEWNIISEVSGGMNEIFFIDSANGWTIGDSGKIFATEDGGKTWLPQISGTENRLLSICFIDDETGCISGYNRTLIYTNNKGNTWIPVQVLSDTGSIYDGITSDDDNNLYFITNYGEVYCSNDSGKSWFNKYNFSNWGFSYIDYSNSPICFAKLFDIGVFFKSTDGGNVWKKLIMPPQFTGDFYFLNSNIGWVTESWVPSSSIHDSASIYITTDGGETWTRQSTLEGISVNNIVFTDTLEGWASSYFPINKIYYTSNSGHSWICQFESQTDSIGVVHNIFFLNNRNGWALTNQGKVIKYGIAFEVSVDKSDNFYTDYIINQNYPNPFNPSTRISYYIPNPDFVTLKIYDLLGREVQTLVNEFQRPGNHTIYFDANNLSDGKAGLSSGIYFYKFQVGNNFFEIKKMLFLK